MVINGRKEITAEDIIDFTNGLKAVSKESVEVRTLWKSGWHVWPTVLMYLGDHPDETESGVNLIAEFITRIISQR